MHIAKLSVCETGSQNENGNVVREKEQEKELKGGVMCRKQSERQGLEKKRSVIDTCQLGVKVCIQSLVGMNIISRQDTQNCKLRVI